MKTVIGLTGAYCAGKNAAAAFLESTGWYTIDLDKLGHKALEMARGSVIELLGEFIINANGTLDRKKIAEQVFSNPSLLTRYEAIVHPVMFTLLDDAIEQAPSQKVCINAAILYKIPHVSRCTVIIEIQSLFIVRLLRGIRRDKRSVRDVLNKMLAQYKLFANRPDSIPIIKIYNIGTITCLEKKIAYVLSHFT